MADSDGESGHPCLVPLCRGNGLDMVPFVITVAMGEEYRVLIQSMNDSPKPNFCNVEKRNLWLTLSKAFSASREVMMVLRLLDPEMVIRLKSLRMLSEECRPLMKPV